MVIPDIIFFSFFSGYQGTRVHDGTKYPGMGFADASVFAPYGKKVLPLWKLDRQQISQQNPLRERQSTVQEMFTFAVAKLVGSRAAGTVVQAREVSDNMRDIPEGRMGAVWACVMCDV